MRRLVDGRYACTGCVGLFAGVHLSGLETPIGHGDLLVGWFCLGIVVEGVDRIPTGQVNFQPHVSAKGHGHRSRPHLRPVERRPRPADHPYSFRAFRSLLLKGSIPGLRRAHLSGRDVGVYEYGDPDGRPVFALHGTPACGAGFDWTDAPAREALRDAPDRPGIPGSPIPFRWCRSSTTRASCARWPTRSRSALKKKKRVRGDQQLGGGPYALAVAHEMPDPGRVARSWPARARSARGRS